MSSISTDSVFSQVDELLLEEACADSSEAKSSPLRRARKLLEDAIVSAPENPDLHHALGICWYHEPEWSAEMRVSIERCFRTALQAEPGHKFATLYLGHFCFDERRYREALELFSQVDESYFNSIGQHWRVLKNRELVLCCRLHVRHSVGLADIEDLCRAFERADSIDVPVPTEIVQCLSGLRGDSRPELNEMIQRVLEMIRRIDFEGANSISDGLEALRQSVSKAPDGV